MAGTLALSIVAPDRTILDEPVQSVIMPGTEGYLGILKGHVPLITSLKPGFVEYLDESNQRHFVAVSGGFAEVAGDRVSVLADAAERANDIDVVRAEADLERARQALHVGGESTMTNERAVQEIERAMNRIKVSKMSP